MPALTAGRFFQSLESRTYLTDSETLPSALTEYVRTSASRKASGSSSMEGYSLTEREPGPGSLTLP